METVEATHEKLLKKFFVVNQMINRLRDLGVASPTLAAHEDVRTSVINEYYTATASTLVKYYAGGDNSSTASRYRAIIDSRSIDNAIDSLAKRIVATINRNFDCAEAVETSHTVRKKRKVKTVTFDAALARLVDTFEQISIYSRKTIVDMRCVCGGEYKVIPELSQKMCEVCGLIKSIKGIVFRNDHCYPQETQRQKHSSYDTSKHYTFWITRLQAIEKKIFEPYIIDQLKVVIRAAGYTTSDLTCERMREMLKKARMNCDSLNEHVPLLIKTFGGVAPPILTPQESKILHTRFSKAMLLYTMVNPSSRNKPYYPYYIGQLIAELFKDDPEKRRLLNYIHLQSAETVRKNNEYYQQMCDLADPDDGIVYHFVGWGAQSWTL